jgi:crossover junction endodeoxyribonuclease RuvC
MRILGIDPGLATIGWGVIETNGFKHSSVAFGHIQTPTRLTVEKRLAMIFDDLDTIIKKYSPECATIEELFFNTNITTGIAVAHGRGVILASAEKCGIPLFEYTPSQVKLAVTGYGKADKHQVMDMTKRLLNLKSLPRPDDAADALAIALCHARSITSRLPQAGNVKETI